MRTITETTEITVNADADSLFEDELPATPITLPVRSSEEIADDEEFLFWAE